MTLNDARIVEWFLSRLQHEFPECNCLMSAICLDGGAALSVMQKHSVVTVTLQIDARRLRDARYIGMLLQLVREQLLRS